MRKHRKASDIYRRQNTLLHRAFSKCGLPYSDSKEVWCKLASEIAGREVGGLSELTLGERHALIIHLQQQGMRIFAPAVPAEISGWKKGDEDIEYEYRLEGDPQIRMLYAIWCEMGYREKSLRGLCWRMFKVDDPRWLKDSELRRLLQYVKYRADRKGCGNYYVRKTSGGQR
ncbi:MAG: DUF1018 domain-containing protein [Deltaproteobacteria bacterium]|nr:DUF1018 domain-containing protein [Deltaproteobacteria bacterium]MBW2081663.1 DUF1018 domain-containing protein [Deltaproteobacteria bacterium]MBW2298858.1 DUF1018 domain-containing protein [Deltaproteobacteria bacterium]